MAVPQTETNSLKELMAAFTDDEGRNPVTAAEFQGFWKSCTDAQKEWYKIQPLILTPGQKGALKLS